MSPNNIVVVSLLTAIPVALLVYTYPIIIGHIATIQGFRV